MQKYAKEMFKLDPKARLKLKFQYAFIMIGVVFAFSIGGLVYQYHQINGVALFGIILESLALLSLFAFWCLPNKEPSAGTTDDEEQETKDAFPIKIPASKDEDVESAAATSVKPGQYSKKLLSKEPIAGTVKEEEKEDVLPIKIPVGGDEDVDSTAATSVKPPGEYSKNFLPNDGSKKSDMRRSSLFHVFRLSMLEDDANANYSTCDLPATWVNLLLCASFGIEAITIGYVLSIGPIFVLNEFDKGVGAIGILFAVGAATGASVAIGVTCTAFGRNLMRRIAASPFDLCFAMGGIVVGVFTAAVPNFVVHVMGLIFLMAFNDLGATLMTELQASITTVSNYSLLGPLGQVVRRSLNVATALTGPVLFGIYPRLPYFVAGTITLLWAIMLFVLFKRRFEKTVEIVSEKTGRNKESVMYRFSFATTEVVHTMVANRTTKVDA